MAPQRHRYTKCILFTGQRANKSNERVVCKYCSEAESPQWALQNALLCNTKKLVKSHLRRCRFFHAAQAGGADEAIVFTEDEDDASDTDDRAKNSKASTHRSLAYIGDVAHGSDGFKRLETAKRQKLDANAQATGAASALTKLTRGGSSTAHVAGAVAEDQDTLERLLLNATLANGWKFTWVDQRASGQLLQYFQPYTRLPTSEVLAGRVLKTAGEKEAELVWGAVEKERIGCTMVLDSWKQVLKQGQLGTLVTTSQGEVLVWNSKEVKEARDFQVGSLQNSLSTELGSLESSSVTVLAVIADSSDGYACVRRALRRSRRDLMVLPCVAHQLNAFITDMFSLVPTFLETVHQAIDVVVAIQRSADFQRKLREKQHEREQGEIKFQTLPDRLEWESLRALTVNLLAAKEAIKAVIEDSEDSGLPEREVRTISSGSIFWQSLVDLDSILFHVARWIEIIKLHQGRLHYVPIVKDAIATTLQHQLAPEVGSPLLERLEARWDEWEHPLMILAVVLNPAFGWKFIDNSSGVTLMRLSCWARYYFESFFGSQPHNLPNELVEYVEGDKFWCSPASIGSFVAPVYRPSKADPVDAAAQDDAELFARLSFKVVHYWKSCSTDCPELSKLALRIFAVAVTTASTDGLFETSPAMEAVLSSSSDTLGQHLQLAATRVRARTKYEQRHNGTPSQYSAASDHDGADPTIVSAQGLGSSTGAALAKLQAIEHAKLDELLKRWDDQAIHDVDQDVERGSNNENEAINSMYNKIHPADDKFSKYSIQTLFLSK